MSTAPEPVNILLVDDSPANLLALESILETTGAKLHRSTSGALACEQVVDTDFAVILLDVRMPTMDGFETATRIRNTPRSKSTPIIFLTAQSEDQTTLEKAYSVEAVDFLTKPLVPQVLVAKVRFFVELYRSKEQLSSERAFLAAVLEAVEDGIVACDAAGTLTLFNRATREMHGLPVERLAPNAWAEHYGLYGPDGKTRLRPEEIPLARALSGEHVTNTEMVIAPNDRSPRVVLASGRPLLDEGGRKLGAVISMHDVTARHEAEAARRTADALSLFNERLAEVFRQAPAFMCVLREPSHVFEMVNDRFVELVGHREVIGKTVLEALPEVAEQGFVALLDRVYETGDSYVGTDVRLTLQQAPGGLLIERFVDFVYLPLRGPDGQVSGVLVHGVDLTERKIVENALKASERRVRLATEAAGLGVWMWDPAADVVSFENDRSLEIFGLPSTSTPMTAARFRAEFLVPGDRDQFARAAGAALRTGAPFFFEGRFNRPPDGQERWVELTGRLEPKQSGSPLLMLGTAADITDRKQAEAELRSSELRYRALFESMAEGFCLLEMIFDESNRPVDWRYLETNPAFMQQTGTADAVGRTGREVRSQIEPHWLETYGRVALTGEPVRLIQESRSLNRWFEVSASRHGGGDSRRVAVFFSDITSRKKAEDELRAVVADLAQADQRKNEFLATLAHELRNPLAPLRSGLHLLRRTVSPEEPVNKTVLMMERQLGHMVHLVDDLLDVARISGGKLELRKELTDIQALIDSAVDTSRPFISARQHELIVEVPQRDLPLDVDPTRIAQVLSNLLDNAAKYTAPGGQIAVRAVRDGDDVLISVADNGVGLEASELPKVFDMFTQVGKSAQGGLGIGLSLVRRLVEMHGGAVWAESDGANRGSMFKVRLPLDTHADGLPAKPARAGAATAGPLEILIVDDNVDGAESLAALLAMSGHSVRVAADGLQALRSVDDLAPEVVFLDIGMPGMSGYEVARALRNMPSGEKMVISALTGWGSADDKARAREAGFDHHLTKPVDLQSVEDILRTVSNARGAA